VCRVILVTLTPDRACDVLACLYLTDVAKPSANKYCVDVSTASGMLTSAIW
jgi:hypothetical protein